MNYRTRVLPVWATEWRTGDTAFGVRAWDTPPLGEKCPDCGIPMLSHGYVLNLGGEQMGTIVCPGDWLVRWHPDHAVEVYSPGAFAEKFEQVQPDAHGGDAPQPGDTPQ